MIYMKRYITCCILRAEYLHTDPSPENRLQKKISPVLASDKKETHHPDHDKETSDW